MGTHVTDNLRFNFGYLLDGNLGENRRIEIEYPSVKLNELLLEPLKGYFRASRTTQGIYTKGELQTIVSTECSRCSKEFSHAVKIRLDDHFYTPKLAPLGEYTIDVGGIVDMGPLVREIALVAIPLQPICSPDCQGLCIECGQNLNSADCGCEDNDLDPRMAVLKKLLDNQE